MSRSSRTSSEVCRRGWRRRSGIDRPKTTSKTVRRIVYGKSHPWTNTVWGEALDELSAPLVHTNFPENKANGAIGPYEFQGRISGEIRTDQWPPNLSESSGLHRHGSIISENQRGTAGRGRPKKCHDVGNAPQFATFYDFPFVSLDRQSHKRSEVVFSVIYSLVTCYPTIHDVFLAVPCRFSQTKALFGALFGALLCQDPSITADFGPPSPPPPPCG